MGKKRKKLTSAFENVDPDVPTELELRLEEELRLAYEAERLVEEGRGLEDLVVKDVETLTATDRGNFDRVERNWIGEEGDLEKFIKQLTKEQLMEIVKEALEKDKELEESVKKRFGSGLTDAVKFLELQPKMLVSHGHTEANVEKRHLDNGQDQLLVSYRRDTRVVANGERRHLDDTQDQLRISCRKDRRVVANLDKRRLDEAQDQLWISSRRDRRLMENVETRHLDEAQDQLRVSSRRDNKPEFAQRLRRKGKREELAMPEVGAFGTAGAAYLRSYGDEEQPHRPSWGDDYKTKYLPSEYWQGQISGQHWLGVSTYDPPLSVARTFNPYFGQVSDASILRQGTSNFWLNSLPGGSFSAPMNQPGSFYSYNARFGNMQDGYWSQNSQYRQPHSLFADNRHHTRSIPR